MRSDQSLTWRVALLGALSALAGSLIGAVGAVYVSHEGFDRQDASRVREQRESTYVEFIAEAERQQAVLQALGGNDYARSRAAGDNFDEFAPALGVELERLVHLAQSLSRSISLPYVYGSNEAILAAEDVRVALLDAVIAASQDLVEEPPYERVDKVMPEVADAIGDFVHVTRADLGVDEVETN